VATSAFEAELADDAPKCFAILIAGAGRPVGALELWLSGPSLQTAVAGDWALSHQAYKP
jgi:hypothetical protein